MIFSFFFGFLGGQLWRRLAKCVNNWAKICAKFSNALQTVNRNAIQVDENYVAQAFKILI